MNQSGVANPGVAQAPAAERVIRVPRRRNFVLFAFTGVAVFNLLISSFGVISTAMRDDVIVPSGPYADLLNAMAARSRRNAYLQIVVNGAIGLVFGVAAIRAARLRIVVNERGIKAYGLDRNVTLAWSEIDHFVRQPNTFMRRPGLGAALRTGRSVDLLRCLVPKQPLADLLAELNAAQAEFVARTFA